MANKDTGRTQQQSGDQNQDRKSPGMNQNSSQGQDRQQSQDRSRSQDQSQADKSSARIDSDSAETKDV